MLVENGELREANVFSLLGSEVIIHTVKQAKSLVLHNPQEGKVNQH